MKLEHFLTPYTKINSKWIKDLNVRPETIKLLEENIGKTLSDINHSKILYDPPPRVMEKLQASEWEKIIANKATDKEFISKIYKPTHVAQYQKNKRPNQKRAKELNRHSPKKTYRWLTNI